MLQVLCQLLNTSNLEDIQSWLVSASQAEKDQARFMINSALRGLKESERTSNQSQQAVDLNSLSNFVDRQKNEEKYASQKYVKDTLNRPVPALRSIDEEHESDINLNDSFESTGNNSNISQNTTTYKRAYQNYNQRSPTSLDGTSTTKKNDFSNDNEHHQNGHEEQIDTIQLDDDRQRPRSASSTKTKKPQSPIRRPPSSHKQKHHVETMQINDEDDADRSSHHTNDNEILSSSNKTKPPSTQDDTNTNNNKSRKIRQLQHKLSRQEEETKKKFDELQSKQSRLENAIKLLVKQTTTTNEKRQPSTNEQVEDLDVPVVNVIIQSPRETDLHEKSKSIAVQNHERANKNRNGNSGKKLGDYTIEDVKVQISLSRLDNHSARVYSGVWKPDASTLNRLQGNDNK